MLTLVGVVLLISVLIINAPRKPTALAVKEDAWLEFVSPEFATIVFDEAPALVIILELIRPVPADDNQGDVIFMTDETTEEPVLPSAADPLRWLDGAHHRCVRRPALIICNTSSTPTSASKTEPCT